SDTSVSPQVIFASALLRHAKWYLSIRDTDALRARAGKPIWPRLLRGSMAWTEGIVRPTGRFTTDPEAEGTPGIFGWQDSPGNPPAIAIEVCGEDVRFTRRLLASISDCLAVQLNLKRAGSGRPRLTAQSELAAYHRDHLKQGKAQMAKALCACGESRH